MPKRLAPMVDEAMREAGLAFSDLRRLAVTTAPAHSPASAWVWLSCAGLRVALKIPLIGITTLEAMATAAMAETGTAYGVALHDAKRNEVYFELLHEDQTLIPSTIATFEDAMAAISRATQNAKLAFAGTAAEKAATNYPGEAIVSPVRQPDALWVARIALTREATARSAEAALSAPAGRETSGAEMSLRRASEARFRRSWRRFTKHLSLKRGMSKR